MPHLLRNSVTGYSLREETTGWAPDNKVVVGAAWSTSIKCIFSTCRWLVTFSGVNVNSCLTTSPAGGSFKPHGTLNGAWSLGNRTHNAGASLVFWYYQTSDLSDIWAECFTNTTCTGSGGDLWKWFTIILRVNTTTGNGVLYAYLTAADINKLTGFSSQETYFLFEGTVTGLTCLTSPYSVTNGIGFVPTAVVWKGDCVTPGAAAGATDVVLSRMMGQGSATIESGG